MNSRLQSAIRMLENDPRMAGNPKAREMLEIIRNGDEKRGEEVANNILATYQVTKEQALARAREMLGL